MKLVDLKQGMVCELRNGYEIIILSNDSYVFDNLDRVVYQLSKDYNDNLISTDTSNAGIDYDIIKVSFGNEVIYERQKSNLFFEPKKGEEYYYVMNNIINYYENSNSNYDEDILEANIVFKTREEAEKELLRRRAKIRVIKEIARLNQGWDVREHWEKQDVSKFYIGYHYITSELEIDFHFDYKALDSNLYLKTRELAKQLIETHSDDLKLMLEVENEENN